MAANVLLFSAVLAGLKAGRHIGDMAHELMVLETAARVLLGNEAASPVVMS